VNITYNIAMEEEYLDVLQNIEMAIVSIYRKHPDLTDYQVDSVLEALSRTYIREKTSGAPVLPKNSQSLVVYGVMKTMCDWRLGREVPSDTAMPVSGMQPEPLTVEVILACLKRLRKSVSTWNQQGGTRGYLDYISQFLR
jgi:hypothetical protein